MAQELNASKANGGKTSVNRRKFIAGAAALSFTVIKPELVRSAAANSKIKLGLVGCGGRGNWIANLFNANGNYEIVAAADFFQDRVDSFGGKFNVPQAKRFTGLSCHKKLLAEKLDAVAIITSACRLRGAGAVPPEPRRRSRCSGFCRPRGQAQAHCGTW